MHLRYTRSRGGDAELVIAFAKPKLTRPCQMIGMVIRRAPNETMHPLLKFAVGLCVFAAVLGGWSYLRPWMINRFPLPDSVADADASECGLWFIGSSSIEKWSTLARDFPGWQAHRRGIDGARISQIEARALRTSSSVAPAGIIFYAGENDIASGASGLETARVMERLVDEMGTKWPKVPIFVISMKPSPGRWPQRDQQLRYDNEVRSRTRGGKRATFITAGTRLLRNGLPDSGFYVDGIHLNAVGYALWSIDIRQGIERSLPRRSVASCQKGFPLIKPALQ